MAAVSHQHGGGAGSPKLQAAAVAYSNTHGRAHVLANVQAMQADDVQTRRDVWRHEHTHKLIPVYLGNLMFNIRAHRTPTAILKTTELLRENVNILE